MGSPARPWQPSRLRSGRPGMRWLTLAPRSEAAFSETFRLPKAASEPRPPFTESRREVLSARRRAGGGPSPRPSRRPNRGTRPSPLPTCGNHVLATPQSPRLCCRDGQGDSLVIAVCQAGAQATSVLQVMASCGPSPSGATYSSCDEDDDTSPCKPPPGQAYTALSGSCDLSMVNNHHRLLLRRALGCRSK